MVKRYCPVCKENYKAPSKSPSRTSPLRAMCGECERKRNKLKREGQRRVREFMENMRTIG